jgi:hypothetical protein
MKSFFSFALMEAAKVLLSYLSSHEVAGVYKSLGMLLGR